MNLTKTIIDRAAYGSSAGGRCVLWDGELSGFGLRIYPSGKKTFVLSYRFQGRKRLFAIGQYGALTVQQARDLARGKMLEIFKGSDPVAERKKVVQGETMADLCQAYLDRYARIKKKSWQKDAARIQSRIIPTWSGHKARMITRNDIGILHNKIGKDAPYEANRVLDLLSKMFELAKEWKMIDENTQNPSRGIARFPEIKRERYLAHGELPRVAEAIAHEPNLYIQAAFYLYLLTGLRKTELLEAKWEHVDLSSKSLRIPRTKSGNPHVVHLSDEAVQILSQLPQIQGNPFILPGHKEGTHLVNISKPWNRIRKRAGVKDVRIHDLRRTVGSYLAQSGNSLQLIGKVLNHSSTKTTAVYAHLAERQTHVALEDHGRAILKVLNVKKLKLNEAQQ